MAVKKAVSKSKAKSAKRTPAASSKTVKKKAAPKKKAVPKKKVAPKKKAAPKKKVTAANTKKKPAVKVALKKKVTVKKKTTKKTKVAAPKKKIVAEKKATPKKKFFKRNNRSIILGEPFVGLTLPVPGIDPYQSSRGESYMNDEQYAHFRKIHIEWKKQLMEEVDRTVDHMKSDAANYADPADRATQEEEFSLELRTRDRERKLIKKIDESLAAIDMGDYGYCESCGIEIGIRRLEARPTATLCIDCKTLQEIKEKQIYS